MRQSTPKRCHFTNKKTFTQKSNSTFDVFILLRAKYVFFDLFKQHNISLYFSCFTVVFISQKWVVHSASLCVCVFTSRCFAIYLTVNQITLFRFAAMYVYICALFLTIVNKNWKRNVFLMNFTILSLYSGLDCKLWCLLSMTVNCSKYLKFIIFCAVRKTFATYCCVVKCTVSAAWLKLHHFR